MATDIIARQQNRLDDWGYLVLSDDAHALPSLNDITSTLMNMSGHQRSYSDAPDFLSRPALPSISHLMDVVGQADRAYRTPYQGAQAPAQSPLPAGPTQYQFSIPYSAVSALDPGHMNGDSRTQGQYARPQQNGYHPVPERHHSLSGYHRPYVTPAAGSGQYDRNNLSYVLPQSMLDAASPSARVASKTVVREEIIPGKGLCWVYDDGSICQKIIDGNAVNPKWGTTKAGKPRKRLGQACNTCREKKIKCDPSAYKCTQCLKFGRECTFEPPSRNANRSPKLRTGSSPNSASEEAMRMRRPSVALTEASSHSESSIVSSRAIPTPGDSLSSLTTDSNFNCDSSSPNKRAKLLQTESEQSATPRPHRISLDAQPSFALDADPFSVDRKITEMCLRSYNTHVNNSAFCLVPEAHFMKWAEHTGDKSQASILVLYCMLAMGCSFSKSAEKQMYGKLFADIALEGVAQSLGHFSLYLIQARLIFALYEFQNGRDERAWDLCGAAMRTACAMNLNTEAGIEQHVRESKAVYGLDPIRFAECMRRTFWVTYTLDCLGTACFCVTTTFNRPNFCLRLPCSRPAYEKGVETKSLLFDGEMQDHKVNGSSEPTNVGTLGYLMQIASLCSCVRTLAFQAMQRFGSERHDQHVKARADLEDQLKLWKENYTAHIRRGYGRSSRSQAEYPLSFGGLHLIYHYACMQLHRNVPYAFLTRNEISSHAQKAYYHAEQTLVIAEQFSSHKSQNIFDYHFTASNPLSGYAVHYAIDILSAAGTNTKLLENSSTVMSLILNSVQLLDNLADTWSSARTQKKQVTDRVTFLMNSANAGITEGKIGYCMEQPMITSLSRDEDLVYGSDRMLYLKSFDWAADIQSISDLNTVSNRGKRASYSMWTD